jgi:predicted GH43/DUF377 family glycosyl hydrolase
MPAANLVNPPTSLQKQWRGVGMYENQSVFFFHQEINKEKRLFFVTHDYDVHTLGSEHWVRLVDDRGQRMSVAQNTDYSLSMYIDSFTLTYCKTNGEKRLCFAQGEAIDRLIQVIPNTPITEAGVLVPDYRFANQYVLYFGEHNLHLAFSGNLRDWQVSEQLLLDSRIGLFDHDHLRVMGATVTPEGILVVYDSSVTSRLGTHLQCGAVLFSFANPHRILWRSDDPLFDQLLSGKTAMLPLGASFPGNKIVLSWVTDTQELFSVSIPNPFSAWGGLVATHPHLKRFPGNPIISPLPENDWEAEGTFNPGAMYDGEKVHLFYRGVSRGGVSSVGYATSRNGFEIDERLAEPIYAPTEAFEGVSGKPVRVKPGVYTSGGVNGGCEDPKVTKINDKIYMTYVAYNGWSEPRIAITSIDEADFYDRNWRWEKPQLMSPPGVVNKSANLLPEKIAGKFVVFHRVYPDILIDFVDRLEFGPGKWLSGQYRISPRKDMWDSRKVSIGATPIKTDAGWFVIYHAVDERNPARYPYKIGAMILDSADPTKVLYRSRSELLTPEMPYESEGKPYIAYPSGAAVIDDLLFVYYGGGDKHVCVATADFEHLLFNLTHNLDVRSALIKSDEFRNAQKFAQVSLS